MAPRPRAVRYICGRLVIVGGRNGDIRVIKAYGDRRLVLRDRRPGVAIVDLQVGAEGQCWYREGCGRARRPGGRGTRVERGAEGAREAALVLLDVSDPEWRRVRRRGAG